MRSVLVPFKLGRSTAVAILALLIAAGGCGPAGSNSEGDSSPNGAAPLPPDRSEASQPSTASAEEPRPPSGQVWVIFGSDTVTAEVARTADQREQGLMDRTELGEDAGMLFVFETAEERSFWMANTVLPLDIAYMDPQFRIFTIKPMEPMSEELVESDGRAQYALEVNQGWFAEHGVTVGAQPQLVFGR